MLGSETLDDLRPRGHLVPHPAALDALGDPIQELDGEPVRVSGERALEHEPRELPVAGRAVLAGRALGEPPARAKRLPPHAHPGKRDQAAEAEALERRHPETADRLGDVEQGVAALVAVVRGVGERAHSDAVEHDEEHPHPRLAAATA